MRPAARLVSRALARGVAACALLASLSSPARAGDSVRRIPLPEPVFTETVTDIDGTEPDVEVELNGQSLHALAGGASFIAGGVEAEWLLMRELGMRVEARVSDSAQDPVGGSVGASWKLVQDFVRDEYLQAEIVAHTIDHDGVTDPGDSPLPLAFDLRAARRVGTLTLRASLGVEAGGSSPHVPLRTSLALLTGFARTLQFGLWGLELEADGARAAPVSVALDLEPNLAVLGLPFRLGFAIPYNVGADATRPSVGLYVRLFFESAREIEYGRTGR